MKFSKLKYIILLSIVFCKTATENKTKETIPVFFQVSEEHQNYFLDLPKNTFDEKEMEKLFLDRSEISNEVCEMVYGKKSYDKKKVYSFIRETSFSKPPFQSWGHPLPKLISGCWNFFRLNDVKPNLDFELIKKIYPTEKKDCYSVGFLQIYLMHSILGCNTVTMIDIDWRILEAHSKLIQLYQKKKLDIEENLLAALKTLKVNWVARFDNKPMEKEIQANLDTFCYYLHHELCKTQLLKFQKDFLNLETIYLQLSSLHDFSYKQKSPNTKIIYLSNAIDDLYTSKDQFKKMIQSIYDNLVPKQKVIFIHHSAGWSFFGVYEMVKLESAPNLRTVCKDVYKTTPAAGIDSAVPYITHFERWDGIEKAKVTCESLLKN